jgi:hypothetical protein
MLAVGRQKLGTVLIPCSEQRLKNRAGECEDLVKIDQAMLDGEVPKVLRVEETQIPDGPFADVVAIALPRFRGRILALALLGGFPGCFVSGERVQRAQDDVSDLGVFQVACLGHHDDINTLSIQQLADGQRFLARGKSNPTSGRQPRTGQEKMISPLVRGSPAGAFWYHRSFIVVIPRLQVTVQEDLRLLLGQFVQDERA